MKVLNRLFHVLPVVVDTYNSVVMPCRTLLVLSWLANRSNVLHGITTNIITINIFYNVAYTENTHEGSSRVRFTLDGILVMIGIFPMQNDYKRRNLRLVNLSPV